jgi:hypothetical protein
MSHLDKDSLFTAVRELNSMTFELALEFNLFCGTKATNYT